MNVRAPDAQSGPLPITTPRSSAAQGRRTSLLGKHCLLERKRSLCSRVLSRISTTIRQLGPSCKLTWLNCTRVTIDFPASVCRRIESLTMQLPRHSRSRTRHHVNTRSLDPKAHDFLRVTQATYMYIPSKRCPCRLEGNQLIVSVSFLGGGAHGVRIDAAWTGGVRLAG